MKKIISLMLVIFVIFASIISITSYAQNPKKDNLKIVFDNKNASLIISINNTQYFHLEFLKLYVLNSKLFTGPFLGSEDMKDMHIKKEHSYNFEMGNYTKITMWKNFTIENKMHHPHMLKKNFAINISFDFYIADKPYTKNNVTITKNMIRYDTKISTNIKNYYIFLEEKLNYGEGKNNISHVFECNNTHNHWKNMGRTTHVTRHHFGYDHMGIIGFGRKNVTFKYMWEYRDYIDTLYSYDGSQFLLYFGFKDTNGTIIQDPYITLPVNLSGGAVSLAHTVKNVVNYIMDHALSFGLGLIIAVVVIFSAPILKKRRL